VTSGLPVFGVLAAAVLVAVVKAVVKVQRARRPADPERPRRRVALLIVTGLVAGSVLLGTPAFAQLLRDDLKLGALCDVISYTARLPNAAALEVLEEVNVDARSDVVLRELQQTLRRRLAGEEDSFPPAFSRN